MAPTAAAEAGGSADADGAPRMAKFLCSFGGAILPRPLDGCLRYVGGKTRIVMLPRDISYSDLAARMRELFEDADIIKYQQPDEDLDGLVSVVNDDDVVNMMEENDKLIAAGEGFTRLRIFLFSHHLDDEAASAAVHYNADERETERRYVDALNSLGDVRSPSSPVSVEQQGGLQFSSSSSNSSSSSSSSSRGLIYTSRDNTTEGKLHNEDMEPTSQTMRILQKITNNFSEERALGQGAYGKVYRGVYDDGQEIAVKLLYNNMQAIDDEQFIREFDNLMMLKHPNIVRLVGYCYETRRQHMDFEGRTVFGETTYRALCFEYMHKGSLQKHLSDECDGPDWHTRYKIIKGTCEGLKYLHEGLKEPFYHLDLKPDNILLDEDMVPKLADFGLSKIFGDEKTRVTKSAIGTIGYMPPEYLFGSIVSKKLDIFSLGVVITKIIAGPRGHTRSAEMSYQEFLDQVQENWRSRLVEKWSSPEPLEAHCQQVNKCAEMALRCIEMDRNKRPSIVDIMHELNETEIVIDKAMSGSFNLMAEFGISRAIQGSLWAERQSYDEFPKAPMFDVSELEILFSAGLRNSEATDKSASHVSGPKPEKIYLIDLRRAKNCGVMLTKVKMSLSDLMRAILALDDAVLDADKVDLLIKFIPTKEEIELLKGYKGDKQVLGECEKFFMELMKVPRVESKLKLFSFKIQFCSQVSDLKKNLKIVYSSTEEIKGSEKLKKLMQMILSLGNALNQGATGGPAVGFRFDILLQLSNTRAHNNKMTLMHYLCKVLSEKLPELLDFPKDLTSLELATKIQLKTLAEEMQAICKGLEKAEQELVTSENDGPVSEIFREALKVFLNGADTEVRALLSLYSEVGRKADAIAQYIGEDPARYPFEKVITTLHNFVIMFKHCHEEMQEIGSREEESSERSRNGK